MRWYAIILCLSLAAGTAAMATPFLPGIKGMNKHRDGLWIDRAASAGQVAMVEGRIASARQQVADALGSAESRPEWQVCLTPACDAAARMSPPGITYADRIIQISSRGALDPRIFTHQAVHAELRHAAGLVGWANAALPTWLDEGLAVLISQSAGWPQSGADCAASQSVTPPATPAAFSRLSGPDGAKAEAAYRLSACAARHWLEQGRRLDQVDDMLRRGEVLR